METFGVAGLLLGLFFLKLKDNSLTVQTPVIETTDFLQLFEAKTISFKIKLTKVQFRKFAYANRDFTRNSSINDQLLETIVNQTFALLENGLYTVSKKDAIIRSLEYTLAGRKLQKMANLGKLPGDKFISIVESYKQIAEDDSAVIPRCITLLKGEEE